MATKGLRGVHEVKVALDRWHKTRIVKATAVCSKVVEPMLEARAKKDAPWTDRTGEARRRLHAKTIVEPNAVIVQLHHGVYYGVFLEVSRAGKFAILKPTLDKSRADIMQALRLGLKG